MASYNSRFTTRNDSSSGSDEADSGQQGHVATEIHYTQDCGYKRYKLTANNGRVVYIWLRSCECVAPYTRTPFDIVKGVKDLKPEEGKDAHFSAECRWRSKKRDTGMGTCWEWKRKCRLDCTRPKTASYTGNHNQTRAGPRTKYLTK